MPNLSVAPYRNHYYSVIFDKEFVKMKIKKFFQQVILPVEQIQDLVKESLDFDSESKF